MGAMPFAHLISMLTWRDNQGRKKKKIVFVIFIRLLPGARYSHLFATKLIRINVCC